MTVAHLEVTQRRPFAFDYERIDGKLHFAVEPCPVDWRLEGRKSLTHFPNQADEGLQYTNLAVREWLGLVAYRLAGRIGELLPGPT